MSYPGQPAGGPPPPPPIPAMSGRKKGCLVSCLVLLGIICICAVVGIYMLKGFVSKHLKYEQFDISSKNDPALNSGVDQLLPTSVGTFTRDEVTTTTSFSGRFSSGTATSQKNAGGFLTGNYKDPSGDQVVAFVLSTRDMQKNSSQDPLIKKGLSKSQGSSQGFSFSINFNNASRGYAIWSKPNWSYIFMTSSTVPQSFVKDFQPGK